MTAPMDSARSTDREPPYSIEAEQAVLGSILIDSDAILEVADVLQPDDFYRLAHAHIYRAILEVWESREPPDIVLVSERIEKAGLLDAVGGRSYLFGLSSTTPSAVHAGSYAKVVAQKSVLRKLISAAGSIAGIAYSDPSDTDEAIDRAQELVYSIASKSVKGKYSPLHPLLMAAWEQADFLYENKGSVTGIASGYRDLDILTMGFHPSDLIILAARPSVGKTSFALNMAANIGAAGKSVGIFSVEMNKEQLVLRLISGAGGIDSNRLRTGYLEDEDFRRLSDGIGLLDRSKIYIDDTPSLSIMELRTKARRMKSEVGLDILIVDYLQLMHAPGAGGKDQNRVQEVSAISRGLKTLARELDVPTIALSQLSRGVEGRDNPEPRLSDLRESGSIEQDADMVLFLWRGKTDEYGDAGDDGEVIKAKLAKNRNGATGDFELWFRKHQTKFYPMDDRYA